jgi:hypothetical protein
LAVEEGARTSQFQYGTDQDRDNFAQKMSQHCTDLLDDDKSIVEKEEAMRLLQSKVTVASSVSKLFDKKEKDEITRSLVWWKRDIKRATEHKNSQIDRLIVRNNDDIKSISNLMSETKKKDTCPQITTFFDFRAVETSDSYKNLAKTLSTSGDNVKKTLCDFNRFILDFGFRMRIDPASIIATLEAATISIAAPLHFMSYTIFAYDAITLSPFRDRIGELISYIVKFVYTKKDLQILSVLQKEELNKELGIIFERFRIKEKGREKLDRTQIIRYLTEKCYDNELSYYGAIIILHRIDERGVSRDPGEVMFDTRNNEVINYGDMIGTETRLKFETFFSGTMRPIAELARMVYRFNSQLLALELSLFGVALTYIYYVIRSYMDSYIVSIALLSPTLYALWPIFRGLFSWTTTLYNSWSNTYRETASLVQEKNPASLGRRLWNGLYQFTDILYTARNATLMIAFILAYSGAANFGIDKAMNLPDYDIDFYRQTEQLRQNINTTQWDIGNYSYEYSYL